MHPEWDDGTPRNFDLLVSYYTGMDFFEDESEYQHVLAGPPWRGNAAVCREFSKELAGYEYVAFADDDIMAPYATLSLLFEVCRDYALDLATPAVSLHVPADLPLSEGTLLRYMDRSDLICPVFSQRALERLMSTFSESESGWGLPQLWSHLCPHPAYVTAVVDAANIKHLRPLNGDRALSGGVRPMQEQQRIYHKYGLIPSVRRFFGSLPLPAPG
jgi:hypothetical protein